MRRLPCSTRRPPPPPCRRGVALPPPGHHVPSAPPAPPSSPRPAPLTPLPPPPRRATRRAPPKPSALDPPTTGHVPRAEFRGQRRKQLAGLRRIEPADLPGRWRFRRPIHDQPLDGFELGFLRC